MKNNIKAGLLLLIAGIFLTPAIQAQKGLKVGGFALPQKVWLLNSDDLNSALDEFDYESTFGMGVGGVFGYNFHDMWGFRVNLLYSVQGQEYSNKNDEGEWVRHTNRLHYLKMPVLVGFNTNTEFNKLVFSAYAGFSGGLLARARYYNDDQSYTPDQSLFDNITDYPKTYKQYSIGDFGPVADIGLDIKVTYNIMANLHLRGDYGLGDAENKNASYFNTQFGIPQEVPFYSADRLKTHNLAVGLLIGLTYTFSEY